MTKLAFHKHARVQITGIDYVYQTELPGGSVLFIDAKTGAQYTYVDPDTGETRLPTEIDIEDLLASGSLKPHFLAPAKNQRALNASIDEDLEALMALDKYARTRQWWICDWEKRPTKRSDRELQRYIHENAAEARAQGHEKLPSPSTLRRWIRFRGNVDSRPLSAMVSMSGRVPRKRSFDPRTEAKIAEALDDFWSSRDVRDCEVIDFVQDFIDTHNGTAPPSDQLKKPSAETIRQRIRKSETAERFKAKFGAKAFRVKYRAPHDRRLTATNILETAIVDHTVVDAMLVVSAKHRTPLGRPTLVVMIDVAARAILAYYISFSHPSTHTVSRLLKRATRPKPHLRKRFPEFPEGAGVFGLPHTIVYDRALETSGVSHRDALGDLGVEVVYAGAGEPQAKGIVERFFRTLNELLFHRVRGSVPLSASLMREMGYDPTKDAVITLEELDELIEEAINVYHYQIHGGIDAQPIRIWVEQAQKGVRTLHDPAVLDNMIGITKHPCTLDRAGVRLFGLQYSCERNVPILLDAMAAEERTKRGKRKGSATAAVKVKYNPDDIGVISVFNSKDKAYYELKCTDLAYAEGTSLWQHEQIKKYAKSLNNKFCSPQDRRAARMALRQSIEAACPEIGLKAKRAQKKLRDGFAANEDEPQILDDVADDVAVREIPQAAAAYGREDLGVPQHSPQRGKSARRRNGAKRKPSPEKTNVAPLSVGLITMTEEIRAAAAAGWRMS